MLKKLAERRNAKRKQRQQELRDYLTGPVDDFPWLREYTDAENQRGLRAIRELRSRIEAVRPRIPPEPMDNQGYMFHLYSAKKALDNGQYSLACHELLDVLYFYYRYQQVLCVVSDMLRPYCGVV